MIFVTVENVSSHLIKKGIWRPLFKERFNSYYNEQNRQEYELDLQNRLFSHNNDEIIILENSYPFIYGENEKQYVIWIKNENNDPGINQIVTMINDKFPEKDYIVHLNKMIHRSIKTILHYHAIIKEPSKPINLKKLIIFHTYGSGLSFSDSVQFGKDIREIYQLDNIFLSKIFYSSSPDNIYIETKNGILKGLKIHTNIIHFMNHYNIEIMEKIEQIEQMNIPELDNIYNECIDVLDQMKISTRDDKLCPQFIISNTKHDKKILLLIYFYEHRTNLRCYLDSVEKMDQIEKLSKKILNILCHYFQIIYFDWVNKIIVDSIYLENDFIIYSANDIFIFVLAKYFAEKNGNDIDLELPNMLSNIRIEEWDDGIIKIHYDNWYLGNEI